MEDRTRCVSILRIFAARARAEIERMRVEQELRASEQRFRDLYDEAPIAYIYVGDGLPLRQRQPRRNDAPRSPTRRGAREARSVAGRVDVRDAGACPPSDRDDPEGRGVRGHRARAPA